MANLKKETDGGRRSVAHDLLGMPTDDIFATMAQVAAGLPFVQAIHFLEKSGFTAADTARALRIPARTWARRKEQGRFTMPESERLLRLAQLFDQAVNLFEGNIEAARHWFCSPCKALGERQPLALAESELGGRAVADLIGRLEYGVYS